MNRSPTPRSLGSEAVSCRWPRDQIRSASPLGPAHRLGERCIPRNASVHVCSRTARSRARRSGLCSLDPVQGMNASLTSLPPRSAGSPQQGDETPMIIAILLWVYTLYSERLATDAHRVVFAGASASRPTTSLQLANVWRLRTPRTRCASGAEQCTMRAPATAQSQRCSPCSPRSSPRPTTASGYALAALGCACLCFAPLSLGKPPPTTPCPAASPPRHALPQMVETFQVIFGTCAFGSALEVRRWHQRCQAPEGRALAGRYILLGLTAFACWLADNKYCESLQALPVYPQLHSWRAPLGEHRSIHSFSAPPPRRRAPRCLRPVRLRQILTPAMDAPAAGGTSSPRSLSTTPSRSSPSAAPSSSACGRSSRPGASARSRTWRCRASRRRGTPGTRGGTRIWSGAERAGRVAALRRLRLGR